MCNTYTRRQPALNLKQIYLMPSTISPKIHHCLHHQHYSISQWLFYLIFTPVLWGRYDLFLWTRELRLRNVKWLTQSLLPCEQTCVGSHTTGLPPSPSCGASVIHCENPEVVFAFKKLQCDWRRKIQTHLSNRNRIRQQVKRVAKVYVVLILHLALLQAFYPC